MSRANGANELNQPSSRILLWKRAISEGRLSRTSAVCFDSVPSIIHLHSARFVVDTNINLALLFSVKFIASFLIATWLLCWVHCFVEQSDVAGVGGCCETQVAESQDQPIAFSDSGQDMEESPCVQGIFTRGLKLSEKLAAMPVILTELPADYFSSSFESVENLGELVADIPRPPTVCFRLWEFMARTSVPVRGPTLIA